MAFQNVSVGKWLFALACLILIRAESAGAQSWVGNEAFPMGNSTKLKDHELCEARKKAFKVEVDQSSGKVRYQRATSQDKYTGQIKGIAISECSPFPVTCESEVRISVDKATQTVRVENTKFQGPRYEEGEPKVSTGKLRGVVGDDKSYFYADTPEVKRQRVTARSVIPYQCSKQFEGSGMPFAIPFGTGGRYMHGIDGSKVKAKGLGLPASAGCVRLSDETACRVYATLAKCKNGAMLEIVGNYAGDEVFDSNGTRKPKETREAGLERARAAAEKWKAIDAAKAQARKPGTPEYKALQERLRAEQLARVKQYAPLSGPVPAIIQVQGNNQVAEAAN